MCNIIKYNLSHFSSLISRKLVWIILQACVHATYCFLQFTFVRLCILSSFVYLLYNNYFLVRYTSFSFFSFFKVSCIVQLNSRSNNFVLLKTIATKGFKRETRKNSMFYIESIHFLYYYNRKAYDC